MKTNFLKTALIVLMISVGTLTAQTNVKKQVEGQWKISKAETPGAEKEYEKWKTKLKTEKDENAKAILEKQISNYENSLNLLVGLIYDYKSDNSCRLEIPTFAGTSPNTISGKWSISADNKKLIIQQDSNGGKTEYTIVKVDDKELVLKLGLAPQTFLLYLDKN